MSIANKIGLQSAGIIRSSAEKSIRLINPFTISNLAQWNRGLLATDLVADSPPVGEGKEILTAKGLTVNNNILTQPTTLEQPIFKNVGINNKPALSFDGVDDSCNVSNTTIVNATNLNGGYTIIIVFKWSDIGSAPLVAGSGITPLLFISTGGGTRTISGGRIDGANSYTMSHDLVLSEGDDPTAPAIIALTQSSSSPNTLYYNHKLVDTNSNNNLTATFGSFGIGEFSGIFYNGIIGQFVIYQKPLITSEIIGVGKYLTDQYNF